MKPHIGALSTDRGRNDAEAHQDAEQPAADAHRKDRLEPRGDDHQGKQDDRDSVLVGNERNDRTRCRDDRPDRLRNCLLYTSRVPAEVR